MATMSIHLAPSPAGRHSYYKCANPEDGEYTIIRAASLDERKLQILKAAFAKVERGGYDRLPSWRMHDVVLG